MTKSEIWDFDTRKISVVKGFEGDLEEILSVESGFEVASGAHFTKSEIWDFDTRKSRVIMRFFGA